MIRKVIYISCCAMLLFSCAKNDNLSVKTETANKVEEAINQQINMQNQKADGENSDSKDPFSYNASIPEQKNLLIDENLMENADKSVDYDLTVMNADMVYASVYQLMVDPEDFIGKTFKMEGIFYAQYYEVTNKNYYYLIIEDALACCAQGMEFVWGDGNHVYPDDYPKNQSRAVIKGKFETYKEDGDDRTYCRIANAEFTPIE